MIINSEIGTLRRHRHKVHEIRAQHQQPPQSTDSKGDNSSDRSDTVVTVWGTGCVTPTIRVLSSHLHPDVPIFMLSTSDRTS